MDLECVCLPPLVELADVLSELGRNHCLFPGAPPNLRVCRVEQGMGQGAAHPCFPPDVPTHLNGREHKAHDEVGEPVHCPVHHEGGRPGGLQEDLSPHHGGDGTSRAESTG